MRNLCVFFFQAVDLAKCSFLIVYSDLFKSLMWVYKNRRPLEQTTFRSAQTSLKGFVDIGSLEFSFAGTGQSVDHNDRIHVNALLKQK